MDEYQSGPRIAVRLESEFKIYHFMECATSDADDGFDYRLRPGMHYASNALRTLGAAGFPDEIVRSGREHLERMNDLAVANDEAGKLRS